MLGIVQLPSTNVSTNFPYHFSFYNERYLVPVTSMILECFPVLHWVSKILNGVREASIDICGKADVCMEMVVLMGVHHKNIFPPFVKTVSDCVHYVWIHVKLSSPRFVLQR
jgi:hypothetical protein